LFGNGKAYRITAGLSLHLDEIWGSVLVPDRRTGYDDTDDTDLDGDQESFQSKVWSDSIVELPQGNSCFGRRKKDARVGSTNNLVRCRDGSEHGLEGARIFIDNILVSSGSVTVGNTGSSAVEILIITTSSTLTLGKTYCSPPPDKRVSTKTRHLHTDTSISSWIANPRLHSPTVSHTALRPTSCHLPPSITPIINNTSHVPLDHSPRLRR